MKLSFNKLIYLFSLFAISLSTYRVIKTDTIIYVFLIWNLFLAFIPYWISQFLVRQQTLKRIWLPLVIVWLLFLPNSPYILTDLFHLKRRALIPLWFDLVLICSYALIGFTLFYKSLIDMVQLGKQYISNQYLHIILPIVFWLIAFGLYLGRYLRFNSWDIVQRPVYILNKSVHIVFQKEVIGFTLIFGVFMWLVYLILVNFNVKDSHI